jgi:hypothetical protein
MMMPLMEFARSVKMEKNVLRNDGKIYLILQFIRMNENEKARQQMIWWKEEAILAPICNNECVTTN